MRFHHAPCLALGMALLLISGCTTNATTPKDNDKRIRVAVSPNPRAIISALFASSEVPLTVHPSCISASSDPTDATIGDYVSDALAKLHNEDEAAYNFVSANMDYESAGDTWNVFVEIGHSPQAKEREWRRRIEFSVRKSDYTIDPTSYRCFSDGAPD
jgi:hypothetical protein